MRLAILQMATLAGVAMVTRADENTEDSLPECGLYLSVSSTSTVEEPKWGLFAGMDYEKGQSIGFGDVAVNTFHLLANSLVEDEEESLLVYAVEFLEQYLWVPHMSGGQLELDDGGRIITAIPGAGVLGGFNQKMTNADWNQTNVYHRPAWNEHAGLSHPGRGASSSFFNAGLSSSKRIPAGMEIFLNYGDNWSEEDEEESAEISPEDHTKIDETIQKMVDFFSKHASELDDESKHDIYQFLIHDVMSAAAGAKKGAKIANMLPETPDELAAILQTGGSLKLASPDLVRSVEWLSQYGRCMDNIRPGPSTITSAGRGAIANRDIDEGELVAPVPLVQIAHEAILEMHTLKTKFDEAEGEEYFVREEPGERVGSQLLLNYVLGHPESTMMFLPAGAAAGLINHADEPNAKLVWSNHPNHHKHWYDLEPEALIEEGNRHLGLLMEVVAIKDIEEGEEVFIDYGPDWRAAWAEHLTFWEEQVQIGEIPSTWPKTALDLNQEYKDKPFDIDAEYPDNVAIKCFLVVSKPENEPPVNADGEKVRIWVDNEETIDSQHLFDCELADREEGPDGWLYTIRWRHKTETTLVRRVAHKAIVFMDKPGESDHFLAQGFRHWIGIPDEIFPHGPWRNVIDPNAEEEASDDEYGAEEESSSDDDDVHAEEDETDPAAQEL